MSSSVPQSIRKERLSLAFPASEERNTQRKMCESVNILDHKLAGGLKKNRIFSKCEYLHVKIASLATVKSCVTLGPIH